MQCVIDIRCYVSNNKKEQFYAFNSQFFSYPKSMNTVFPSDNHHKENVGQRHILEPIKKFVLFLILLFYFNDPLRQEGKIKNL